MNPSSSGKTVIGILAPASGVAPPLSRRMASWLYEGMLMFGVVFVAAYLFGSLSQTRNAMDNRHALQGFLFVIFGIYFVWFWSRGQTLAMKTWHIRLVDQHNQPVSQARALWRYLLSWIWFLPALAIMSVLSSSTQVSGLLFIAWVTVWAMLSRLHPQRQFWHDAVAGTRLVSSTSTP